MLHRNHVSLKGKTAVMFLTLKLVNVLLCGVTEGVKMIQISLIVMGWKVIHYEMFGTKSHTKNDEGYVQER